MFSARSRREKLGLGPSRRSTAVFKNEREIAKEPHYVTFTLEGFEDDSTTEKEEDDGEVNGVETKILVGDFDGFKIATNGYGDEDAQVVDQKHIVANEASPDVAAGEHGKDDDMLGIIDALTMPTDSLAGLSSALFCPITVQWLLENYETKTGVSLPRSTVYNHYIRHCRSHEMEPVNAASFGKLIRSIFLGLQTRRLGTRGNSKYHYYGIQIKPDSPLNDVHETESGTQSDSEKEDNDGFDISAFDQSIEDPVAGNEEDAVEVPDPEDLVTNMYVNCRLEPQSLFKLSPKIPEYNDLKEVSEWQTDIKLITKFTCDPTRKDLLRKIRQEMAKLGSDIPQIDHKLVAGRLSKTEVENFRQSYKKFNQMMIRSTVLYKLDTLIVHCYQYWMGIPLLSRALHFTKDKLKAISENEAIKIFMQTVDCQVYDIMLELLFPDILHPIPVVVIDVVRNFGRKYAKSLEIILKDYPKDMREKKLATADAFSRLVLDRCRLNMLADTLRPLFEEAHRTKSYQRLKDLNVPSALSVSIYPIANEDKYFYLVETYRQALANILSLEGYADWIKRELHKAVGQYKSSKDTQKFEDAARAFAKDTSYVLYVICSQMAFMDEEVNSFFALLHLFTNEYVAHLLEDRRARLKNVSIIQYVLDPTASS